MSDQEMEIMVDENGVPVWKAEDGTAIAGITKADFQGEGEDALDSKVWKPAFYEYQIALKTEKFLPKAQAKVKSIEDSIEEYKFKLAKATNTLTKEQATAYERSKLEADMAKLAARLEALDSDDDSDDEEEE